uniref:Uncharacterized protein n=1 Tax=Oryza glumipatula TaxID=40148 RepID=A0A0D9YDA5_9ORYZ
MVRIGDDEQPKTTEIKRVKIAVHVARICSMILVIGVMLIIYNPMSYVKPMSYKLVSVGEQHDLGISVVECTRFLVGSMLAVIVGVDFLVPLHFVHR